MGPYKQEERIRILQAYLRTMSISETQRDYCIHFKTRISPTKNAIKSLIRKFQETGAVHDAKKTGRPKLIRTEVQINCVATDVANNSNTSIRRRSLQLGITRSSLQRILKKDLKLFPYKIQLCQELLPTNAEKRLAYAKSFLDLCEID